MDILPSLLAFNIRRAQIAVWRGFSSKVSDLEVTPSVISVLMLTNANPGIAQIELANELHIDKANMVALIDKLEAHAWVVRKRSLEDRRRHGIYLTTAGARAYRSLKRAMLEHEKHFNVLYSDHERHQLLTLLQRMHA